MNREWISVDDKMPMVGDIVDVWTENDVRYIDIVNDYDGWVSLYVGSKFNGKVTHWMTMPEAPKGRSW